MHNAAQAEYDRSAALVSHQGPENPPAGNMSAHPGLRFTEKYTQMPGSAARSGDVRFSNRPFGVKHFQAISTTAMSMSLTGSRFSSESAPGPFHHGIRGRGGTIFTAALPSV